MAIDENRTREMIRMRFGELMTLQEIGDEFGITRERVRQILGNTGRIVNTKRDKELKTSTKPQREETGE